MDVHPSSITPRGQPWRHPPRSTSVSCAYRTASRAQSSGSDHKPRPSLVLILFSLTRPLPIAGARPSMVPTIKRPPHVIHPCQNESYLKRLGTVEGRLENPFIDSPGDRPIPLGRSMPTRYPHEHRRSFLKAGGKSDTASNS